MKTLIATTLLVLAAMPASAQGMNDNMRGPTARQCHMGYKTSYMRTMHWSRAAFREACEHKMMMMKKDRM